MYGKGQYIEWPVLRHTNRFPPSSKSNVMIMIHMLKVESYTDAIMQNEPSVGVVLSSES